MHLAIFIGDVAVDPQGDLAIWEGELLANVRGVL
jgi:hypothetical protein